ncbi:MAG: dihydrodipicolinate synthase family protein [Acidobacteria bacterium]|nr:dihydrodipicolinate synthase family protein [Acidobacteriota bacterium]
MKLRGVVPVMLLPLNADESIDENSFRNQVDFAIQMGAVGVCAPAFGTEFYKLSDPERYRVARILVEQTAGRVPVFISTGSGSTHSTVEFSRYAESIGADGLMVVAPDWCSLGVRELTEFYEAVCRSVSIPVMVQDADFTGAGLPAKLFVDLAERCPNFLFAKLEVVLPGKKCAEIIRASGGRLQVLYGMGGIAVIDGLAHGACGIMPGSGLVDVGAEIFRLYDSGDAAGAKALSYRLQPFLVFALQHLELAIYIEKRVLVQRGVFPSDRMRRPTVYLDNEYQKQAEELVSYVIALSRDIQASSAAGT